MFVTEEDAELRRINKWDGWIMDEKGRGAKEMG